MMLFFVGCRCTADWSIKFDVGASQIVHQLEITSAALAEATLMPDL